MSFELLGIGTATPEHSIEQADAVSVGLSICAHSDAQTKVLPALYRRTGVRTRHSVVLEGSTNGTAARQSFYAPTRSSDDAGPSTARRMQMYEERAAPLALVAATAALQHAKVCAAEVTHLVTVSCSGFSAPGVDVALIRELGLNAGVSRTHVGFMGCHAALNALRVAKAFTDGDPRACVLLCAVELCSLHLQYGWDPDRIVSNALFADGAAAVVGKHGSAWAGLESLRSPGDQGTGASGPTFGRCPSSPGHPVENDSGWQIAASGSTVIPDTEEEMGWRIGNHGFEMSLSPRVPELIHRHLGQWLAGWLSDCGLTIDAIGSWAVHPGGPRILSAIAEAARFDPALLATSREVLAEFGNMSSPTVLFILDRLQRRGVERPCVMLAFGPGLTIEAVLVV